MSGMRRFCQDETDVVAADFSTRCLSHEAVASPVARIRKRCYLESVFMVSASLHDDYIVAFQDPARRKPAVAARDAMRSHASSPR
jgi:hypothetical protein